jgi:AcrR family transcriptional regulator
MKRTPPRRTQGSRTQATTAALLKAAQRLFGENGYEAVSLDDIAAQAGVTKGALYHHFPDGKAALFQAVFLRLQRTLTEALDSAAKGAEGVTGLRQVLTAYFDAACLPAMHRITLLDAPSVLGPDQWRESERRHALRHILESVDLVLDEPPFSKAFKATLAQAFYGAMYEATFAVMAATDKAAAKRMAIDATAAIVEGAYTVLLRGDDRGG